jgi:acyl-CoA synthetase (AMP-forming)/AMP-acid ligase II
MNLALLLEMAADGAGRREALVSPVARLSYADLLDRAKAAAGRLSESGRPRLGLLALNSEVVPIALFGSALAGRPFAPLNYRLADDQLGPLLVRLAPALLVGDAGMLSRAQHVSGLDPLSTDDFLVASATGAVRDAPGADGDPDAIAVLLFTSGTTGDPKAAVLRHRHLTSYVLSTVEFMSAGEDEATLVAVPPYHVAGIAAVLSSVYAGRRIVYLSTFSPEAWLATAQAEAVTHAMVVPTMLRRIVDVLERSGSELPALRHVSYGGGRMPVEVVERAMALLPTVSFVNAYGLTETSSSIAVLGPDDHREAFGSSDQAVRARLGSVGRPLPSLELEIRDAEGRSLPLGARGEIWVRGEQVSGEYLGRGVVLTDEGWFRTNDGGWLDGDGYLYVEGRLDDVIVRGGENMSPGEIEDVLASHPAVADAAVFGVPDEDWGETVAAAVVLREGSQATVAELQDWVRDRLRSSRMPEHVDFRSELPYSETGKLLRRQLKAEWRPPA